MGCHGWQQINRSELTRQMSSIASPANSLYFAKKITSCGRENPSRSFMWQTTPFQQLFSTMECMSTEMHHCMFGSSRRKLTRLIHNIQAFHHLHQMCDNQYEHEPWGQKPDGSWATSEKTAYQWPLARAIATQVVIQLQDKGIVCYKCPASQNKNAHCKPCVPPQTFSHAEIYHHSCQNSSTSYTTIPKLLYHLILVYSALPKGVCRECKGN